MSFEVIATPEFEKTLKPLAKKYPAIKDDLVYLIKALQLNPQQGKSLGKDCYKVRMPITGKNTGKSGGARLITCVKVVAEKIYLLSIYDKAGQSTMTDKELKEALATLFPDQSKKKSKLKR